MLVGFHGLLSDVYLYPICCVKAVSRQAVLVKPVGTNVSIAYAVGLRVQVGYCVLVSVSCHISVLSVSICTFFMCVVTSAGCSLLILT